jgi:hypothetical protein
MKILDDPKIPTARRSPWWPHHSHKLLDVAIEMGLKPGRIYWRRCRRHHLGAAPPILDPRNRKTHPPANKGWDPPCIHGLKTTWAGKNADGADGRHLNPNCLLRLIGGEWVQFFVSS